MTNVHRTIDAVWKLESAKIIAGLTRMVHDVGLAEELAQEIQASRSAARIGPSGEPVQLHEQNRGRWDQLLIRRDFLAMLRARELGGTPGLYVLQLDGIRRELGSVHSLQRGAPLRDLGPSHSDCPCLRLRWADIASGPRVSVPLTAMNSGDGL